jgi:DNA-binding response OmpR family regulator
VGNVGSITGIESVAGSGKTPLLNHLLREHQSGRLIEARDLSPADADVPGLLCIDDVGEDNGSLAAVLAERHHQNRPTILAGRSGVKRALIALPPGDVELLGFSDLQLDDATVRERFLAAGATAAEAASLARRCDGWAVAIAFAELQIADAGGGWDRFWAYARQNVLDEMDALARSDLMTVACTPLATITDFAREAGCSLFDAQVRLRALPFVSVDERGHVQTSPLVLTMLRACDPAELLARARALAASRTVPSAAIATLLRGGDLEGAAQMAERSIEVVPALDAESHALLGELPQSVLRSYPRLWMGVGMPRWWHDNPQEMVESALVALDAALREDIDTRYGLTLMLLGALMGEGQRERANVLVTRLAEDARTSAAAPHHPILAILLDAVWRTFDETEFDIDAVRNACSPLFASPGIYFIYLMMPLWTWYRIHGRFTEALETHEKALSVARELMPGSYVDAIGAAIYTAWLVGDTDRKRALLALHRDVIEAHHFHGAHGFFAHAAIGDPSDEHRAIVRPWFLAEALLMRASLRDDASGARRDLDEAIAIAKRLGFWEMAITGLIALAAFDDDRRVEHLLEAASLADRVGTIELYAAIDAMAISDGRSALQYSPVVGYFERLRPHRLRLSLLDRTVHHNGKAARVSRQQFAILAVVALAKAPIPRRELGELISSDGALVPEAVLEVQLARLRQRLGANVIVHDSGGYRFGVPFSTDWHEAHTALRIVRDPEAVRSKIDAITKAAAHVYERSTELRAAESHIAAATTAQTS